ncbi:shikimate kinase [Compostibacter hankyongensis]|uniref:Shikimate kinase n=1 Tax=Compostibacter hankyongensis TaxID=1007089 RepID=A0ABP8G274_9BACT
MKIFLLGFMGSGKSYWGRQLAAELQLPLYDLDAMIVKAEQRSITEIFAAEGEDFFRRRERDMLRETAAAPAFVLSCGGGAPCFFDNMSFMNVVGLTIWLNPPVPVMTNRLRRNREKRPLVRDLDDAALEAYVTQKLEERRVFYEQARLIIDPVPHNVATFAEKIRQCTEHT